MILRVPFVLLIPLIAAALGLGSTLIRVYQPGIELVEEFRAHHHQQAP